MSTRAARGIFTEGGAPRANLAGGEAATPTEHPESGSRADPSLPIPTGADRKSGMTAPVREDARREAEALEARGELPAALAAFAALGANAPDDPGVLEATARLSAKLGQETSALKALAHLSQVSVRTDDGWRALLVARELSMPPVGLTSAIGCVAEAMAHRTSDGNGAAKPLWAPLNRDALVQLLNATQLRTFEAGDVIVTEGDRGTSMFAIAEGQAHVCRTRGATGLITVAELGPGRVFGEVALVSDAPRMATVVARTAVRALELGRADVLRVGWRYPQIVEAVERFCRERALDYVASGGGPWAQLAPQLRRAASDAFRWRAVPAGTELIRQGDPNDALYLLVRGRCLPVLSHRHGGESSLPEMVEGDVFGEISLLLRKPASATVRALTSCALLVLDRDVCLTALESEKGVKQRLTQLAIERLQASAQVLARHGEPDGRV